MQKMPRGEYSVILARAVKSHTSCVVFSCTSFESSRLIPRWACKMLHVFSRCKTIQYCTAVYYYCFMAVTRGALVYNGLVKTEISSTSLQFFNPYRKVGFFGVIKSQWLIFNLVFQCSIACLFPIVINYNSFETFSFKF